MKFKVYFDATVEVEAKSFAEARKLANDAMASAGRPEFYKASANVHYEYAGADCEDTEYKEFA